MGNHPIQQIPLIGHELIDSINDGRPLVLDQPRSAFSRAIQTLATNVRTQFKPRRGR
jgi:MinD-like ATPase involved in chromosome partitioning or flagellar assembly